MHIIDLQGEQGNAFVLLGIASRISRELNLSDDETKSIQNEMTASDYNNLLDTFERHFGEMYKLINRT
jgi:hypothetical protein